MSIIHDAVISLFRFAAHSSVVRVGWGWEGRGGCKRLFNIRKGPTAPEPYSIHRTDTSASNNNNNEKVHNTGIYR